MPRESGFCGMLDILAFLPRDRYEGMGIHIPAASTVSLAGRLSGYAERSCAKLQVKLISGMQKY